MEGNGNDDIVVTGPRGFKARFNDPKLQVVIALVIGIGIGMGVMTWL